MLLQKSEEADKRTMAAVASVCLKRSSGLVRDCSVLSRTSRTLAMQILASNGRRLAWSSKSKVSGI